jgi:uncharacterized protein (TIGR02391 family)
MTSAFSQLPDLEVLLVMEPEELAPVVLKIAAEGRQNNLCHFQQFSSGLFERHGQDARYPYARKRDVEVVLQQAWTWLGTNGFLVPEPGINGTHGFMILTPKGEKLAKDPKAISGVLFSAAFPKKLLHPAIADKVWLALARGDLDDAVFGAFKAVEVAVRHAAKFSNVDIGVPMMRKAFDKTTGPLTNMQQTEAERESLAHLFAGAIGSYKNPYSHRTVALTDLQEAQEIVMLASHLLRIVDARK